MYEHPDEKRQIHAKLLPFIQNFADLCQKNYAFFLISNPLCKNTTFIETMGTRMDVRFARILKHKA